MDDKILNALELRTHALEIEHSSLKDTLDKWQAHYGELYAKLCDIQSREHRVIAKLDELIADNKKFNKKPKCLGNINECQDSMNCNIREECNSTPEHETAQSMKDKGRKDPKEIVEKPVQAEEGTFKYVCAVNPLTHYCDLRVLGSSVLQYCTKTGECYGKTRLVK